HLSVVLSMRWSG
ncbi:bacterial extracellular solute-binding, 7 family protein, partial [Vibrio parahaemolyticus V-223/04]